MIITCPNCSSRFRLKADALGETGRNVKCAKCAHRWFAAPDTLAEEPAPRRAAPRRAEAPPPPAPPPPAPPPAPPPPAPPPPETPEPEPAETPAPEDEPAPEPEGDDSFSEDADDEAIATPPPIPTEEEIARFQAKPPPAKKSTLKWWILLLVIVIAIVGTVFAMPRKIVSIYPPMNKLYAVFGMASNVLGSGLEIPDYQIESRLEGQTRVIKIKGIIKNTTSHVLDVPLLLGTIKDSKGKELRIWSFKPKEPRVLAGESVDYETELKNPPRGGVNVSITFITEKEMEARKAAAQAARGQRK